MKTALPEAEILMRAIRRIEEISVEYSDDSEAWGEVFKLAHWARAPHCRKNHPNWGDALAASAEHVTDGESR